MRKVLLLFFIYALPANANIVPNFVQGNMSSTTTTQSTLTESITSKDYSTGYEYTGIIHDGSSMSPDATAITGTVGGHSYTWTGADMTTKPNWTLTNPTSGNAFQFTETYSGPGLQNVTTINRTIETESVTTTTSVFSQ